VLIEQRLSKLTADLRQKNLETTKPTASSLFWRLVISRRTAEFIISTLLIFGGQQFLNQIGYFSPVWPATGVALSAVFLRGNFLLLGILCGTLLNNLFNHLPWHLNLFMGFGFTFFIWITRSLALRFIGAITPISFVRVWIQFILLIALTCALYTAFLYFLGIFSTRHSIFFNLYSAWLGNFNGILYLTPLCLIFEPFVPQKYFTSKTRLWWLISIAIIGSHFLFFALSFTSALAVSGFLIFVLAFYALAFGQIPTCITLLGISTVYITGANPGPSLFNLRTSQEISMLLMLFTLSAIISITIATFKQQKYLQQIT
jgi:integral membrane sensor domain MASE1